MGNEGVLSDVIEALVECKLLLYRRHNDDLSVWHGTDVDLRGRLEQEKLRAASDFDLLAFLEAEYPPPDWRPVIHNSEFSIRRYFAGRYVEAATLLREGADHPVWRLAEDQNGTIVYAIARSHQELEALQRLAKAMPEEPGIVLAVPSEPLNVQETALEVWALARLQKDPALIGTDPLILPELQQMAEGARQYLNRLMDRILSPAPAGPRWYAAGHLVKAASRGQLRVALSALMSQRFSQDAAHQQRGDRPRAADAPYGQCAQETPDRHPRAQRLAGPRLRRHHAGCVLVPHRARPHRPLSQGRERDLGLGKA
jgi:hypothetical protein